MKGVTARRKTDMCSICVSYRRCLDKRVEFVEAFTNSHGAQMAKRCGDDLRKWAEALDGVNVFDCFKAGELADDLAVGEAHKTKQQNETKITNQ